MSVSMQMYRTKQIIDNDFQIRLPNCMYVLKNLHSRGSKEMVDESTNHVSTANEKSTILDQNNYHSPDMAELEAKQEDILRQLSDLKKQILSIKLDLKINPKNSGKSDISSYSDERLNCFPDLVVNANPSAPPFSLQIFQDLLSDVVNLKFTTHIHSSIPYLSEDNKHFQQSLTSHRSNNNAPNINIKMIWKEVMDTEVFLPHAKIFGEVNLLRYLTRIIQCPLSYSSDSDSVDIDSILDISYQMLWHQTKADLASHLVALNKYLGKSQWLAGRSSCSVGDIAAYSAIKQLFRGNDGINGNLKKWYERCESIC